MDLGDHSDHNHSDHNDLLYLLNTDPIDSLATFVPHSTSMLQVTDHVVSGPLRRQRREEYSENLYRQYREFIESWLMSHEESFQVTSSDESDRDTFVSWNRPTNRLHNIEMISLIYRNLFHYIQVT